jgi:hypothetical protein
MFNFSFVCFFLALFCSHATENNTKANSSLLMKAKAFYGERLSTLNEALEHKDRNLLEKNKLSEEISDKNTRRAYLTTAFIVDPRISASVTAGIAPHKITQKDSQNQGQVKAPKSGKWSQFVNHHKPSLFLSLIYRLSPQKIS